MKIGALPYINALPLLYGLRYEYEPCPPAMLAKKMRSGELDIALLPVTEILENSHLYHVFPNMAIGSRGDVLSVRLALRCSLSKVRKVGLNRHSRVSNSLAKIILKKQYGMDVEFVEKRSLRDYDLNHSLDAQVLIGDEALFHDGGYLDLGGAWGRLTENTPFVYAVWAIRRGVELPSVYHKLLNAKNQGVNNIDVIVAKLAHVDRLLVLRYLTENIKYDLGNGEIEGIKLFHDYLVKMNITDKEFDFPLLIN